MHAKHTAFNKLSKKRNEISTNNMKSTPKQNNPTTLPYMILMNI